MSTDDIKHRLLSNGEEITRLQERIHETFRHRSAGSMQRNDWDQACREFHSRYGELAFPGGYGTAFERIFSGDEETIETALCFLECRPYFFRSGYMWKEILRKLKRASLTESQSMRYSQVVNNYNEWRASKHECSPRRFGE